MTDIHDRDDENLPSGDAEDEVSAVLDERENERIEAGHEDAEGSDEDSEHAEQNERAEGADDELAAAPAIVDESAWADDDDDEDFGHLARLVDDDDEGSDASPGVVDASRPAAEHEIPLDKIDPDALWVVKRLRAKGYEAYLTGGCVRDLLLGIPPKDFDVATAAHPNEVKAVFRNCRLIGRRFRLAHVYFPGGKVIETATFRANPLDELEDLPEDLLVERDNVFGTVEDDARRRDLTINGLFYDPLAGKVIDFVDGRRDLEARLIRTIGDPQIRFQEDPVRIMRAIKFATRLGFTFEEETAKAMRDHVGELVRCAPPRLQEELLRLLTSKHGEEAWRLCLDFGVAQTLVPELLEGLALDLPPLRLEAANGQLAAPVSTSAFRAESARTDESGDDVEGAERKSAVAASEGSEATETTPDTATEAAIEQAAEAAVDVALDATGTSETSSPEEGASEEPESSDGSAAVETLVPPTPEERGERLLALLRALDEIRRRDAEPSTAVVWGALVLPVWEAFQRSAADGAAWLEAATNAWTERLRMTRRDKDTLWLLLKGMEQLRPAGRRGHAARHTVSRPWFRESLLLYTLSLYAEGKPLDEVAAWKAIARHYDQPYRQPRVGERQPRAQDGGDRDRSRGGRRSRRGGGRRGGGRRRNG